MQILCPKMQPIGRLSITETIVSVINKKIPVSSFNAAQSSADHEENAAKQIPTFKNIECFILSSYSKSDLFDHLFLQMIYFIMAFLFDRMYLRQLSSMNLSGE